MIFLGSTTSVVTAATTDVAKLISDPALPKVLSLAQQIYAAQTATSSPSTTAPPAQPISAGIGLSTIVTPLEVVLYAEKNPWAVPVAVAGVLGIPLLFGFFLGRASKRTQP